MKKILIFMSLFIASIYLSSAVNMVLTSGTKLDNNSWTNLSTVLNKVDIDGSSININGKLSVDGKICDLNNNCLGECNEGYVWDTGGNSCIEVASTQETAGLNCKDLCDNYNVRTNGVYFIDPNGGDRSDAFRAYCEMESAGGGWTLAMNLDTNDGNVKCYNTDYWTSTTSSVGMGDNNLTSDFKEVRVFNMPGDNLMIKVHEEGTDKAWKSYNLNEVDKSLGYYFNKGNNIKLTNGSINSNGLSSLNVKEPTIKANSDLYVNTARGLHDGSYIDKDRISIGGVVPVDMGGGLGTRYNFKYDGRPNSDGQLLNCAWDYGNPCRIGNDHIAGTAGRNVGSGLQYDYAIYIK